MKILIVDDHALIRDGLQGVLKKLKRGATVLEAADCRQAMAIVESNPDIELTLLDLSLPDRDGFSVLTELRERYPAMAVAVLSGTQDSATVTKALELGAAGFIPKGTRREVMMGAFQLIFDGSVYVPPQILSQADASQPASTRAARRPTHHHAGRSRIIRAAAGRSRADDAGQEQQGHLPHPQSRRADGQKSRHRHPASAESVEPHRGSDRRHRARLEAAETERVTAWSVRAGVRASGLRYSAADNLRTTARGTGLIV